MINMPKLRECLEKIIDKEAKTEANTSSYELINLSKDDVVGVA